MNKARGEIEEILRRRSYCVFWSTIIIIQQVPSELRTAMPSSCLKQTNHSALAFDGPSVAHGKVEQLQKPSVMEGSKARVA